MAAEGYTKEGSGGGAGIAGADGLPGVPGVDGVDGLAGVPGTPGAPGADGADGAAGVDGDDGAVGPAGADGATGAAGPDLSAVTEGALVKRLAGVPAAAVTQFDYIAPQVTASVAAATTITLPETGLIVPVTIGSSIDFITKPTGNLPRIVILWFKATVGVRHEVAGAGAGAANVSLYPGLPASTNRTFRNNGFLQLMFDGTVWRKFPDGPHFDSWELFGYPGGSVYLNNIGAYLRHTTATKEILAGDNLISLVHPDKITIDGRTAFVQATVASASNMVFTKSSMLVTGTVTMNTFTPTSWTEGAVLWLEFDNILTITSNSGGANDFVSKDGSNITTSAGMVLQFRFDGTDFREVGAPAASFSGVAEGAIAKKVGGVPTTANPALDYVSPLITAPIASASTITLPETGGIVPVTGTAIINFITKPTGDVPRRVTLWLQGAMTLKNLATSPPAGTAQIVLLANVDQVFPSTYSSLVDFLFDGTFWHRVGTHPHWNGSQIVGASSVAVVGLGTSVYLQHTSSSKALHVRDSSVDITHDKIIRVEGRTCISQATVASASNMTFTYSSNLVTGTADMNTFTPTEWQEGGMLWLEFAGILNINCNSGGANDYVSKDGRNITTAPGMVLQFRFDGTDFHELGRPDTAGGVIKTIQTDAGNVDIGEDTLHTYTLPASTLSADGQAIEIEALVTFGVNANEKRVRMYFGATVIYDTGPPPMAQSGGSAWIKARVVRTGAATQTAGGYVVGGATLADDCLASSPTETLSGTVVIKTTGEGTADNDVVCKMTKISWVPAAN